MRSPQNAALSVWPSMENRTISILQWGNYNARLKAPLALRYNKCQPKVKVIFVFFELCLVGFLTWIDFSINVTDGSDRTNECLKSVLRWVWIRVRSVYFELGLTDPNLVLLLNFTSGYKIVCYYYYHEITTQKESGKMFLPHRDLNHGPLELKTCVLPMVVDNLYIFQ